MFEYLKDHHEKGAGENRFMYFIFGYFKRFVENIKNEWYGYGYGPGYGYGVPPVT